MKQKLLMLCAILIISTSFAQQPDQINHLKTFAKAYGYVKYFHPSDEASKINWNRFAAYGADEISKCKDQTEVIKTLNNLFKPIAPSVVFSKTRQDYDFKAITPKDTKDYTATYWQHRGVSKDMSNQNGTYKSVRVNRDTEIEESNSFGNLLTTVGAEKYKGKELKYTGWVKLKPGSEGAGHLWLRVDKADKTKGFFDNMDSNPIKSNDWQQYEIIGEVDALASRIIFGCFMKGKGTLYLDAVQLHYKEGDEWIAIPIKNSDFEAEDIGTNNEVSQWSGKSKGYTYSVSKTENKEGNRCAVIRYEGLTRKEKEGSLFESSPKFGELIEKEIGNGIFCQIPLNLYNTKAHTYPKSRTLSDLQDRLDTLDINANMLAMRLGNVINTYNVFQHFFPYFDEVVVHWEKELETALNKSFVDTTENAHLITLQKFTAPLKDGHIWVSGGDLGSYSPPITWEWIENQLIITNVFNDSLNLEVGDAVTKINNLSTPEYFKEVNSRISAGTEGWLNYKAQRASLLGPKDSTLSIEVNNKNIVLTRDNTYTKGKTEIEIQKNNYKLLDKNIYYLNLSKIEMDTITSLLPKLEQAKGIICDMRGYPNGNHDFISHLLREKDTSKAWMRIPKIIYPDQEKITGYENYGWEMEPKTPYLGDKKLVFITNGRAISYAESYMGFIEGYKLATIVGQPTAGTNGNINPFSLLGGFNMSWTGMKVFKHDGSQHHAIGILPDIYVNKTIEGVKSGTDEFLEKAKAVILE